MLEKLNFLAVVLLTNYLVTAIETEEIEKAFSDANIVPEVIPKAPPALATVTYPTADVQLGNLINPLQVLTSPNVTWPVDPDSFYTLAMIGDLPPRELSEVVTDLNQLQFQHWLVGNIPGGDVAQGETLAIYIPSIPPALPIMEPYRYIFLIYKQPGLLKFTELRIPGLVTASVVTFSVEKFAEKYDLGNPVAGNFYVSQYVTYPTADVQLGNLINPLQVLTSPNVTWPVDPDSFYTLAMIGDLPPRELSEVETDLNQLQFQHWLVGNIPGGDVAQGETLAIYIPSIPPALPIMEPYRYIFLIYKQPGLLKFTELRIPGLVTASVVTFSVEKFAEKYDLGNPVAGNFYVSQYVSLSQLLNLL